MTKATEGYIDLGTGKLYYETAGEGEPLVLAHAGIVDSGMWEAQWQFFARHYRVIRFDLRGFGKSDPVTAPLSWRGDLFQLLKQLDVSRASFIGCSLSGEIILDMALERPKMVAALIPVSAVPGGFELQGEPPPNLMEMIAAVQARDFALASELQMRVSFDGPFRQPEQVDPLVRQQAMAMNRTFLEKGTWGTADANPLNPPAVQRLNEIHIPTLVVAGGLDHPEILRAADLMAAQIPGANKAIIPDTAHFPNMEKSAEFNQIVLDFLQGLN